MLVKISFHFSQWQSGKAKVAVRGTTLSFNPGVSWFWRWLVDMPPGIHFYRWKGRGFITQACDSTTSLWLGTRGLQSLVMNHIPWNLSWNRHMLIVSAGSGFYHSPGAKVSLYSCTAAKMTHYLDALRLLRIVWAASIVKSLSCPVFSRPLPFHLATIKLRAPKAIVSRQGEAREANVFDMV